VAGGILVASSLSDTRPQGSTFPFEGSDSDHGHVEGQGASIGLPYGSDPATCPVGAYRAWLEGSGLTSGAVFRTVDRHERFASAGITDKTVAVVVKRTIVAANLADGLSRDQAEARAAFWPSIP
jgi:hypothetical protein